jgi:hypothetical protein
VLREAKWVLLSVQDRVCCRELGRGGGADLFVG